MARLESQNMFEPLVSLGNNNDNDQLYEMEDSDERDLQCLGGEGVQDQIPMNEVSLDESEPIRPTIQPSNYLAYARKHRKNFKSNGLKRPFLGHQKWVWLTGTHKHNHRANNRAQSSRVVEVLNDAPSIDQPQALDPHVATLVSNVSSPPPPISCAPSISLCSEFGEPSSSTQDRVPSREDVAFSLLSCSSDEDFNRWIRWMVIPFSKEVGMTTSLGIEGQVKMFSDFGRDMDVSFRPQSINLPISNSQLLHSMDLPVPNDA
ncbi:hypothetical protein FRX31_025633 [Thalictrum thalictroides]|uniref:Uncharacterized protein n=1 Tax=Thalictrum thalictroides TaxID=46969 RepID=A0A7J6VKY0_THATH|nr:hypothetical protein FRX31_025633 [Thalictrum thalictroides]